MISGISAREFTRLERDLRTVKGRERATRTTREMLAAIAKENEDRMVAELLCVTNPSLLLA